MAAPQDRNSDACLTKDGVSHPRLNREAGWRLRTHAFDHVAS